MSSNSLAWALYHAAQGLPIFPITPAGKAPLTPKGFHDASVAEQQIRAWWAAGERAGCAELSHGIAIPDGFLVLDVDPRHEGDKAHAEIIATKGLPATRTAKTGRGDGGLHLWFSCPTGLTFPKEIAPGIDAKRFGGYVVAPPSVHESGGRYEWIDPAAPIAAAPDWLVALGKPRGNAGSARAEFDDDAESTIDEAIVGGVAQLLAPYFQRGARHHFSLALGGYLKNRGYVKDDARRLVYALAIEAGSDKPEARAKDAANAWRYDTPAGYSRLKEWVPETVLAALGAWLPDRAAMQAAELAASLVLPASDPAPVATPLDDPGAVAYLESIGTEELGKLSKALQGKARSDRENATGRALGRALIGVPLVEAGGAAVALPIAFDIAYHIAKQYPKARVDYAVLKPSLEACNVPPILFENKLTEEQQKTRVMREKRDMAHERRKNVGLLLDEHGAPKNNLANTCTVLETSFFKEAVGYDLLGYRSAILRPELIPFELVQGFDSKAWKEVYTTRLRRWIVEEYDFEPSKENTNAAIDSVSRGNSFHPVRKHLESLVWDGVERIDRFWSTYFGSPADAWHNLIGPMFLIGCVARAVPRTGENGGVEPCKLDTMPVLEGPQGMRKSTGIRVLAYGDKWFNDTPLQIGNKDAVQQLDGVWICELADLTGIKKATIEDIKAFLSSKVDNIRRAYAARAEKEPRQCAFTATTNDKDYLTDPTGARRFWPVRCTYVDVEAIRRDRDQLWAEAMHRYMAGARYHLEGPYELNLALQEHSERTADDPWEELIEDWIQRHLDHNPNWDGFTNNEVLDMLLDSGPGSAKAKGNAEAARVRKILLKLGWEIRRPRGGGLKRRYYRIKVDGASKAA